MMEITVRVRCETPDCSQKDHVKMANRFAGSPGPGLAFTAPIVCLGCGIEPRILQDGE